MWVSLVDRNTGQDYVIKQAPRHLIVCVCVCVCVCVSACVCVCVCERDRERERERERPTTKWWVYVNSHWASSIIIVFMYLSFQGLTPDVLIAKTGGENTRAHSHSHTRARTHTSNAPVQIGSNLCVKEEGIRNGWGYKTCVCIGFVWREE